MHIKSARFDEALEHRGDLRARGGVLRGEDALRHAVNYAVPDGPGHGLGCPELMEAASSKPSSSAVPLAQPSA